MKFEECVLGVCCRKWTCKFMLSSKRVQDKEGPLCAVYYAVCTALGLPLSGFETMSYNRAQYKEVRRCLSCYLSCSLPYYC